MSDLYRFDVDYLDEERGCVHLPSDTGDYVLAEDALALQAKVEELEHAHRHVYELLTRKTPYVNSALCAIENILKQEDE